MIFKVLAPPPPPRFLAELDRRGVGYQLGRVVVGTARNDEAAVRAALAEAGVDVFRLNMAHGRRDWHEAVLGKRPARQLDAWHVDAGARANLARLDDAADDSGRLLLFDPHRHRAVDQQDHVPDLELRE